MESIRFFPSAAFFIRWIKRHWLNSNKILFSPALCYCEWAVKRIARGSRELINLILCQVWLASSAEYETRLPHGYTYRGARLKRREKIHFIEAFAYLLISAPFGCFEAINPFCFIYFSLHSSVRLKLCHDWLFKMWGKRVFFSKRKRRNHTSHMLQT